MYLISENDLPMFRCEWNKKSKYITSDNKIFDNKFEANRHEHEISRQRFYQNLLNDRNWFQKLFNIKPSMRFYDEMTLDLLAKYNLMSKSE